LKVKTDFSLKKLFDQIIDQFCTEKQISRFWNKIKQIFRFDDLSQNLKSISKCEVEALGILRSDWRTFRA